MTNIKIYKYILNCPLCGNLLSLILVLSSIASRSASGLTRPAGRTTESRSGTFIKGNLTHFMAKSFLSSLTLHQLHTPRKISTSGAKNESLWRSFTREDWKKYIIKMKKIQQNSVYFLYLPATIVKNCH